MRCSKCGTDNPQGMKFCGNCAAPLRNLCPRCGFDNPPGFKFCGECAATLGAAAAPPIAPPTPEPGGATIHFASAATASDPDTEGERKTVAKALLEELGA